MFEQILLFLAFTYDGDGTLVKSVLNGVTTYYIGTHFEWTGSNSAVGAPRRIAERRVGGLSSTGIHPESGSPATGVPCDNVLV